MLATQDLLDLRVGQRSATFRFDLLDASNATIGEVQPDQRLVPSVENNTNRTIKRDLHNFILQPSEALDINALVHRIRPIMILENGAEFPMGVFLFGEGSAAPNSTGTWFTGAMVDQSYILDQPIPATTGYSQGTSVRQCLLDHFDQTAISRFNIDPFPTVISSPILWPAGTSRLKIMNELAAMAGCYSVYFTNDGTARVKHIPDLSTATAAVIYEYGRNIIDGSVLQTNSMLTAPNKWLVIDSSGQNETIGNFELPDSAPHSRVNRGFFVTKVVNEQGLQDQAAADDRARAAALQDTDLVWVTFSGVIDPRHDTFDVIDVLGMKYREQNWSVDLFEGAEMKHECRGLYKASS